MSKDKKLKALAVRVDKETWEHIRLLAFDKRASGHDFLLRGVMLMLQEQGIEPTRYLIENAHPGPHRARPQPPSKPKKVTPKPAAKPAAKPAEIEEPKAEPQGYTSGAGAAVTAVTATKLAWPLDEFCETIVGFHRATFYRLPAKDRPRTFRVGNRVYVSKESGLAWIRKREAA